MKNLWYYFIRKQGIPLLFCSVYFVLCIFLHIVDCRFMTRNFVWLRCWQSTRKRMKEGKKEMNWTKLKEAICIKLLYVRESKRVKKKKKKTSSSRRLRSSSSSSFTIFFPDTYNISQIFIIYLVSIGMTCVKVFHRFFSSLPFPFSNEQYSVQKYTRKKVE